MSRIKWTILPSAIFNSEEGQPLLRLLQSQLRDRRGAPCLASAWLSGPAFFFHCFFFVVTAAYTSLVAASPHTAGKKSFALVRSKLENDKETSETLSSKELFVATRKRKAGRSYKCSDKDTTSKIAEMEEIDAQHNENGNESVEAFASVTGPEHTGRLRLYGRVVTRTSL
nr:uncharacterized protein LOC108942882 [Nicotiana tomentosiformis]